MPTTVTKCISSVRLSLQSSRIFKSTNLVQISRSLSCAATISLKFIRRDNRLEESRNFPLLRQKSPTWTFPRHASSSNGSSGLLSQDESPSFSEKLVIYSKPGCCLCDGLKEKIQAALLMKDIGSLKYVVLEIRDITTNENWFQAYQYEIPVMTRITMDGKEISISRQSPRVSIEKLKNHLMEAFT